MAEWGIFVSRAISAQGGGVSLQILPRACFPAPLSVFLVALINSWNNAFTLIKKMCNMLDKVRYCATVVV